MPISITELCRKQLINYSVYDQNFDKVYSKYLICEGQIKQVRLA